MARVRNRPGAVVVAADAVELRLNGCPLCLGSLFYFRGHPIQGLMPLEIGGMGDIGRRPSLPTPLALHQAVVSPAW